MRYLIFSGWVACFYALHRFVVFFSHQTGFSHVQSLLLAAVLTILSARQLPFLKDQKFPEIEPLYQSVSSFFLNVGEKIQAALATSKPCAVCGVKTDFHVIIEYGVNKDLEAKSKKIFCRRHALEEWRRLLDLNPGPIFCIEPGLKPLSGSFFYEPKDLHIHNYGNAEKNELEKLIAQFKNTGAPKSVGWFRSGSVKGSMESGVENPLSGRSQKDPEIISVEDCVMRMERAIYSIEAKRPKGEYILTEPRGNGGVYLWCQI